MKQMFFSWPFWSFWVLNIFILAAIFLLMFLLVYPYLMRHLTARQRFVPHITGASAFAVGVVIVSIFYLLLPTVYIYACQASKPSGTYICKPGKITIGGSTALNPFIHTEIDRYQKNCENAHIENLNEVKDARKIQGSLEGLRKLSQGRAGDGVDIGTSDIPISNYTTFDVKNYLDYQIAAVKYVVIVNKSASNESMPINLSMKNLQQIYINGDTNQKWGTYGGPQSEIIVPFARNEESGTEVTFKHHVINTSTVSVDDKHTKADPLDIINEVENNPGAIGYVSSYDWTRYGDPAKALVVKISDYSNDNSNILDNHYPFWNIEHLYVKKGSTIPLVQSFIDFLGSKDVINDLTTLDYIPISQIPQNIVETRCSS